MPGWTETAAAPPDHLLLIPVDGDVCREFYDFELVFPVG